METSALDSTNVEAAFNDVLTGEKREKQSVFLLWFIDALACYPKMFDLPSDP